MIKHLTPKTEKEIKAYLNGLSYDEKLRLEQQEICDKCSRYYKIGCSLYSFNMIHQCEKQIIVNYDKTLNT